MITNRDLGMGPHKVASADRHADPTEASERLAARLTTDSLDRVQRVVLRLLSLASVSDPKTRGILLAQADELDAAVRAARDIIFSPSDPTAQPVGGAAIPTEGTLDVVARARQARRWSKSLRDLAWETWTQAIIAHARRERVELSPVVEAALHLVLDERLPTSEGSSRDPEPSPAS